MITDSLQGVIDAGMCIGCAACTLADSSIQLELDPERLIFRPTHPGDATAAAVCPAIEVDYEGLQQYLFPESTAGPYGVVDTVRLAQSTDYDRNQKASSGGLIKELLLSLLRDDEVDGVIALDQIAGLDFAGRLITSPEEIDALPGSIYHNLPQTSTAQILRDTPGHFVLVAIPCQLEGLYTYIQRYAPELRDRVHTTIGLLCGWQYSHHSIQATARFNRFDADDITDISYRGGGPIGKLSITTGDGKTRSINRRVNFGYQVAFDRHMNTPRCHVCVNHGNFLADIVVGDAWLPNTLRSKTGVSIVVCRSQRASKIVDDLVERERIVTVEASTDEIRLSQKERVAHGDFAYAYAEYLEEIGVHRPTLVGPNRGVARLAPREEVVKFHSERVKKEGLARRRRYRLLWIRKGTLELPRFLSLYVNWIRNRVIGDRASKARLDEQGSPDTFR